MKRNLLIRNVNKISCTSCLEKTCTNGHFKKISSSLSISIGVTLKGAERYVVMTGHNAMSHLLSDIQIRAGMVGQFGDEVVANFKGECF